MGKGAFALKHFDADRILQRNFFQNLNLPQNLSDKEIELKDYEDKINCLQHISAYLDGYNLHVEKHLWRLNRFILAITSELANATDKKDFWLIKLEKAHEVYAKYQQIIKCIENARISVSIYISTLNAVDDDRYRKIFARNLKSARKSAGLTQKQLAEKMNMVQANIAAYESANREPTLRILHKFKNILHISLSELCE